MELCFVLQADIKEDTLPFFGMHSQKVGTQSLSLRNSDGICNANRSVSYCVGPNGPRRTTTGRANRDGLVSQTRKGTRKRGAVRGGLRFKMRPIVLLNFTPF